MFAGERLGPGRLVLVIGPSGAGKDTLIARARECCGSDAGIVFPRRIVTRPASSAEDHESVAPAVFAQWLAADAFSLHWQAHGLRYALPRALDDDIRAGRTVVCNVSRTVVDAARERYARLCAVLVTAPAEVLAARLAQRGRESEESITERLRRSESLKAGLQVDFVIENAAAIEAAAVRLIDIIYDRTPAISGADRASFRSPGS